MEERIEWAEILGWGEEQFRDLRCAGFSLYRDGRYEQAYTYFAALVELAPESHYDHQTLGAVQLQLGNNEKALEVLDKALAMVPQDEVSLLNKTKALLMLGKKKDALSIAAKLQNSSNPYLANDAQALIMAYS